MKKGKVYVFTGDGKGKTSAAIGVAIRSVGSGMKTAWISWYKTDNWEPSEVFVLRDVGVEVFLLGGGFNIKGGDKVDESGIKMARVGRDGLVIDSASKKEHKIHAKKAIQKAKDLVEKVDVLVLDEINNAVDGKLVNEKDLLDLIESRGKTHLILTGRNASKKTVEIADLVTNMEKIKHPYDKGELATKGLDF